MKRQNTAFTLAEVLITLAIIGVVAALTIPSLVQGYKKRVVETKLVKFYSTINNALDMSEVDNGSRLYWDTLDSYCEFEDNDAEIKTCVAGTEDALLWYKKYLAKYIKVLKVETRTITHDDGSNTFPSYVILYLPDGSLTMFSGYGWNYYIDEKAFKEFKSWGTTAFPFKLDENMKVIPYYYSGAATDKYDCSKEGNGALCTKVIADNGWKIPKDYPYKF